jgi:hypothetical protein
VAGSTFYDQIAANRRNSVLLALVVVVILAALGFSIGYAITGDPAGAIVTTGLAVVVGVVMSLGSCSRLPTQSSWTRPRRRS